jgi:anti-anti-sigma regulatory factor
VDRNETHWALCLEGDFNLTSAGELKAVLLEGLASGQELQLDLERAGLIDITFLQLLWSAERAAAQAGSGLVSRVSEAVAEAARGAGFISFPGQRPERGDTQG